MNITVTANYSKNQKTYALSNLTITSKTTVTYAVSNLTITSKTTVTVTYAVSNLTITSNTTVTVNSQLPLLSIKQKIMLHTKHTYTHCVLDTHYVLDSQVPG